MKITRVSAISGIERTREIPVNPEDFIAWQQNLAPIDELMPYLNAEDKEFILSGIVAHEWEKLKDLVQV